MFKPPGVGPEHAGGGGAETMAAGLIKILGVDVFCSIAGGGREARMAVAEAVPKLADWARRYDAASARNQSDS